MPHANGKIYSEVVNGVEKGINTDDVSSVLGHASHDVKTLCMSEKINPAAVFRPRFMGGAVHVDPEDFQPVLSQLAAPPSGASGVSMVCVNYGIWVPYFNTLLNGRPWDASHRRWNPRPCDETQFGDLTHFDGYNHNAKFTNPVQSVVCSHGARIQVTFRDNSTSESITARTLFGDNEDAYFGFIVYEYQGDGPVLSGTGAVTPKLYKSNYFVAQAASPIVVTSDFNAATGKSYDIIPIVAVNVGHDATHEGDWEYYSLYIHDNVPGFIRKKLGTNNIEFIYFRYAEGYIYPDGSVAGQGSTIGVNKSTFGFALMMTSPFSKILADTSTPKTTGLIQPATIKVKAKFTTLSGSQTYTKEFSESNGLVLKRELDSNILRMYMQTTNTGNVVFDWASSVNGGSLSGYFDFEITFKINVNSSGTAEEQNTYYADLWTEGTV